MSLTLINRSHRAELALEPIRKGRGWQSQRCSSCKKWIFIDGTIPVEHHYHAEFKPVPFVNVELRIIVHSCNKSNLCDEIEDE